MGAQEYPVSVVCEVVECARSSYYHRPMALPEQGLQQAIEAVAAAWPRYGYRRVTHQLRREGWTVNHKHVARIMRERGLQVHRKPKRRTTTDSRHAFPRYPNLVEQLEIVRPEQVWVSDITYIGLREECVYLAVLMDVADALHSWLAPGSQSRSEPDLARTGAGTGPLHPRDSPLRSRREVSSHRLYSTLANN
jgi:putative transposase